MNHNLGKRFDEQMRRISSRLTKNIALRAGQHYGMYLGSGYPKSGTSWLCQLMSDYLDIPHPQNYSMPIAMSSVLHNHWMYDERFPASAYIRRDGRDVMISLYFYHMRMLTTPRHPRQVGRLSERYNHKFGVGYDPNDIAALLPRFIEAEMTDPIAFRGVTWAQHLESWCETPHANVTVTSYEDLLSDPSAEFARVVEGITGSVADGERVQRALDRYAFGQSGRRAGTEDRASFMRKGIRGDWRTHFTRDAGEVFEQYSGEALREFGYESDSDWFRDL